MKKLKLENILTKEELLLSKKEILKILPNKYHNLIDDYQQKNKTNETIITKNYKLQRIYERELIEDEKETKESKIINKKKYIELKKILKRHLKIKSFHSIICKSNVLTKF